MQHWTGHVRLKGDTIEGRRPAAKRQAAATPAAATTVGYPAWDLFAFAEWVSKFEQGVEEAVQEKERARGHFGGGLNPNRVRLTHYMPHPRSRRLDRTGLRTPEAAVTGMHGHSEATGRSSDLPAAWQVQYV